MARKKRMPTLWEIPDDLWERMEPLLNELDPPKATGRPREDRRRILEGLIFRFRTLSQNPTPQAVLDYHVSKRAQTCLRRLLALNAAGMLGEAEQQELDELQRIEHILVMLKAQIAGQGQQEP